MTQDNNKKNIEELYRDYLRGEISREEFEELFDLIKNDGNKQILQEVIDKTLPVAVGTSHQSNSVNPDDVLHSPSSVNQLRISRRSFYKYAAAASLLILVVSIFYTIDLHQEEWIVHTTDFQETKEVELPDGSLVVLNANSELKWKKGFELKGERIVSFSGEGFFDISHIEGKSFKVSTGSVDVNVLGTEFNLETRRHHTNVFLKEGSVVLNGKDLEPIEMIPGDFVNFDEEKKEIYKVSDQKPESVVSWKEGVFTFDDLTGVEILAKMEDIYGKKFIINNPGKLEDVIVVQGLPYTDWGFTQEALELALGVEFKDSTVNRIIVKIK